MFIARALGHDKGGLQGSTTQQQRVVESEGAKTQHYRVVPNIHTCTHTLFLSLTHTRTLSPCISMHLARLVCLYLLDNPAWKKVPMQVGNTCAISAVKNTLPCIQVSVPDLPDDWKEKLPIDKTLEDMKTFLRVLPAAEKGPHTLACRSMWLFLWSADVHSCLLHCHVLEVIFYICVRNAFLH